MPTPDRIIKFYQSKAWKRVRSYKRQLAKGVCEQCGKAGWEVHHKIPLNLGNVDDPSISINLDNLELLCTSCHNAKRTKEKELRDDVEFNAFGDLLKKRIK